jgi:phosphatidylglycerophosphate synthase
LIESGEKSKREKQREILHKFIDGPVDFLIKHNISPNLLSYIGFVCSLIAAFLIAIGFVHFPIWFSWIIPFLIFWSGTFDVFDGEVARRTKGESQSGAFLDSNLDRLSDVALILGLIYANLICFLLGFIFLFLIIMVSYTRSRAENEGVDMKGVGFMERAERVIYLMFIISIESWIYFLFWIFPENQIFFLLSKYFFSIFMLIFLLLLIITLVQRFVFTAKELKKTPIIVS